MDEYIKSFEKPEQPADPELVRAGGLLTEAREKEEAGDMDGARDDLNEAIDALKSTVVSKKLLSAGYFARGRHWVKREKDYKATKDFTAALKYLDDVNILDRAQVHYHRGLARHRRKKYDRASEDLQNAVQMLSAQMATADDVIKAEMMATKAGWLTMHGLVLADSGDHKAAVALHSEAIETDGNVTSAWSNRASSHEALEQWEDAIRDYAKRIELAPESAGNAYLHRGACLLQHDKTQGGRILAIADMRKACDLGVEFGCKNAEALQASVDKAKAKAEAAAAQAAEGGSESKKEL